MGWKTDLFISDQDNQKSDLRLGWWKLILDGEAQVNTKNEILQKF